MQKTLAGMISRVFMAVLLFVSLIAGCRIASAADSTVKIYIGDSKTARHHMAIALGNTSDEYSFEVKGHEVKSSSYTSSNTASFRIAEAGAGTCKVTTVAEGTGVVTLTVKTTDGKTLTEKVFVSVYKNITSCQAEAVREADVYRGASSQSGVENEDKKGTLSKNEAVTILATCGDYYLFRAKSGTTYEDDKDTGFVRKSDIKIPVGVVAIQEQYVSLEKGKNKELTATVSPGIATNKDLSWKSGNSKIASVNASGKVSAAAEGTTTISATAKDGSSKSDNTYLSVYKSVTDVQGYIKSATDFYAVGNTKVSVGKGKAGTQLTVCGTCGEYYRIKVEEKLVEAKYGGFCYVPKSEVAIPVTAVKLNKKKATVPVGKKLQLTATVSPAMADNKKVTWKSSNKKVATVSSKGAVTAKKSGKTVITVTSVDGTKSDSCEVFVTETKKYVANRTAKSKPTLFIETESMDSVELTVSNIEEYNGFTLYLNRKKYKDYTCKKGRGATLKRLTKLKVNKNYRINVRTFLKAGGKTTYSNMSDEQKYKAGKINISANVVKSKTITISWGNIEGARSYKIYRAKKKNGKYKLIKSLSRKRKSYTDKKVKLNKTYYYKVKPVYKKKIKGTSNIDYAVVCELKSAVQYLSKKYKFICTSGKKKINSYSIGGTYSPVKYRFANDKLEIHVYLEFVTYRDTGRMDADDIKIYEKQKVTVQSEVSADSYVSMFKEGIKSAYQIDVFGGKGDFKEGINFKTELFIHEKGMGEKYNARQKFVEVLIGGECPNCTKPGDHWYHVGILTDYSEYSGWVPIIYMPTHEQVRENAATGARIPMTGKFDYGVISAHELGHVLGLEDAYSDKGFDRCADNSETGYEYRTGLYDNLMKGGKNYPQINANGIEMMLHAVDEETGLPYVASESFDTYGLVEISPVIKDRRDLQTEGEK